MHVAVTRRDYRFESCLLIQNGIYKARMRKDKRIEFVRFKDGNRLGQMGVLPQPVPIWGGFGSAFVGFGSKYGFMI